MLVKSRERKILKEKAKVKIKIINSFLREKEEEKANERKKLKIIYEKKGESLIIYI